MDSYGPYDGYFMEDHDDVSQRRFRDEMRERERYAHQQTQCHMVDTLSALANLEYGTDILQHMEKIEVRRCFF